VDRSCNTVSFPEIIFNEKKKKRKGEKVSFDIANLHFSPLRF
jgi:hypothetical protein